MRKVPDLPTAKLEPPRREPLFHCQIEVVTPMFGGGCETRSVDTTRLVTARSVRGHLRFWWRACKGAQYPTSKALHDAESAIWGSTSLPDKPRPSAVDVVVEVTKTGSDWKLSSLDKYNRLNYGLFAFKKDNDQPEATGRDGVAFTLTVFGQAEVKSDIQAALWAWLLFGGVGARTRRGCGSLYCVDGYSPKLSDFRNHVVSVSTPDECRIPILQGARILSGSDPKDVLKAWEEANGWMYDFRQKPGFARNKGDGSRPGRSRWPEPDSIRRITKMHAPSHAPVHKAGVYFPRADLGLPIVFHMKTAGDPSDTLQPNGAGKARMGSPIILKPLIQSAGKAVPMAVILHAPHAWDHPDGLILNQSRYELDKADLKDPDKNKRVEPLEGLQPREAFMAYVKKQCRAKEVPL